MPQHCQGSTTAIVEMITTTAGQAKQAISIRREVEDEEENFKEDFKSKINSII